MSAAPSKTQLVLARVVLGLSLALLVLGLVLHGLSVEVVTRIWHHLLERPSGPFGFRFVLQPVMAALVALRHGLQDARSGRMPFFRALLTQPAQRRERLDEAVLATARIVLLGLAMDAAYQWFQFKTFHPAEAVIVAVLLAFVPYVLLRGLVARVAAHWVGRPGGGH
jgi:hypothetical protein